MILLTCFFSSSVGSDFDKHHYMHCPFLSKRLKKLTMAIYLQQKFITAASYLARPNTYPFLRRLLKSKFLGGSMSLDHTQTQATAWCRKQAVDTSNAIYRITGQEKIAPIRLRCEQIFKQADDRAAICPQKMGGAGNLDLLYAATQHLQATQVIETGVAYGWSSLAILLAISPQPQARLISTNLHYSRYEDDSYVGCVVPDYLKKHWSIIREADRTAIPKAINILLKYDLCHYDSDKTYAGRMWAYPLLWQSLRVGGYFISDDVGDNLAFAHFCRMVRTKPMIVKTDSSSGNKYVGLLLKSSAMPPRQIMF